MFSGLRDGKVRVTDALSRESVTTVKELILSANSRYPA